MQVAATPRSPIDRFKRLVKDNGLPPAPRVVGALLALMRSDRCTRPQLEALIGTDTALTAALIGFSNSGIGRSVPPASSLKTALARLGPDTIVALLTESLSSGAFPFSDDPRLDDEWARTATLACIGAQLAVQLEHMPPDLAHTFVVLRDCGVTCLMPCVARKDRQPDTTQPADENATLGIDHAHAGALLAASWGLDAVLVAAIRDHHAFGTGATSLEGTQPARSLIAIGVLADEVFARTDRSHSKEWEPGRAYVERELRLAIGQSEQLVECILSSLGRAAPVGSTHRSVRGAIGLEIETL